MPQRPDSDGVPGDPSRVPLAQRSGQAARLHRRAVPRHSWPPAGWPSVLPSSSACPSSRRSRSARLVITTVAATAYASEPGGVRPVGLLADTVRGYRCRPRHRAPGIPSGSARPALWAACHAVSTDPAATPSRSIGPRRSSPHERGHLGQARPASPSAPALRAAQRYSGDLLDVVSIDADGQLITGDGAYVRALESRRSAR